MAFPIAFDTAGVPEQEHHEQVAIQNGDTWKKKL